VMDNAVKYSQPGKTVRLTVSPHETPDRSGRPRAEIAVNDEGIGMDSTTRERAFEQFFRSGEARRLATDGSGIGLYAARGLVAAMDGEIRIESRPGEGSTVILTLPAEAADELGESADHDGATREEPIGSWADSSGSPT
jgi:signal transduction histidine kinase